MIVEASLLIDTISSEPILTGPSKDEQDEPEGTFDTLVNVEKRPGLLPIPPNLDASIKRRFRYFPGDGGWRLFPAPGHVPPGPKML